VRSRINSAIPARAPRLVPPQKVSPHWRMVKLGSLDLGAPLVALAGADLDGDGRGELYAVTTREVVVIGLRGKKLDELGRVAFAGEPRVPAPRDPVGVAAVEGGALLATVSTWARGLRVTWRGGRLSADVGEDDFPVCPGERAQLAPGKNYFGDAAVASYGARCRTDLVDPAGYPLRVRARLSLANKLEVVVERCNAGGVACEPVGRHEYVPVGVAFELADLDRDGRPEVVFAGAGAPGDPDAVKIVTLGEDDKKPRLRKGFTAGGIAGIAALDLDGNGVQEVVAAVRLVGATRIDLWRSE
jgi:hypothetical protein